MRGVGRFSTAIAATFAGLIVGGAITAGAVNGVDPSPTVFMACMNTESGTIRMVNNGAQDCRNKERFITWSSGGAGAKGDKGDPGEDGATGPTGPTGATGATGPAGRDGVGALTSVDDLEGLSCADGEGTTRVSMQGEDEISLRCVTFESVTPDLAAGSNHACRRSTDATVSCWGLNRQGQTGNPATVGTLDDPRQADPYTLPDLQNVTAITAGLDHSCALLATGTVSCWGSNRFGQLGNEEGKGTTEPQGVLAVTGLNDVVAIDAGHLATCALTGTGKVWCWGTISPAAGSAPGQIDGIADAVGLSVGDTHACVVRVGQTVACFGENAFGQAGPVNEYDWIEPPFDYSLTGVVAVRAGGQATCALRDDGTVWCWGTNELGLLGTNGPNLGVADVPNPDPVQVAGLSGVRSFDLTTYHACAIVGADRDVACWGFNFWGQTGAAGEEVQPQPSIVPGFRGVLAVAGHTFSCATKPDATTWCWGSNVRGQRGSRPGFGVAGAYPTPTLVS